MRTCFQALRSRSLSSLSQISVIYNVIQKRFFHSRFRSHTQSRIIWLIIGSSPRGGGEILFISFCGRFCDRFLNNWYIYFLELINYVKKSCQETHNLNTLYLVGKYELRINKSRWFLERLNIPDDIRLIDKILKHVYLRKIHSKWMTFSYCRCRSRKSLQMNDGKRSTTHLNWGSRSSKRVYNP